MSQEPRRLLIVDDEPSNRQILGRLFEESYTLRIAESGEEAVEAVEHFLPDLILMDVMMPGIDGYEACRRIRRDHGSAVPLIFLSARNGLDDMIKGYEAGGCDYVTKPFNERALRAKVARSLERFEERRAIAGRAEEATEVALRAMSDNAQIGRILQFLQESYRIEALESLARSLLGTAAEFGFNAVLQLHQAAHTDSFSTVGSPTPVERELLSLARGQGRIFDFGGRTIFNYRGASLLIKNMPLDDPALYGAAKDNLCLLMDGYEARAEAIEAAARLRRSKSSVVVLMGRFCQFLELVSERNHQLKVHSMGIVENLTDDLRREIAQLGEQTHLTLEQEEQLLAVAGVCRRETDTLFTESVALDRRFGELVELIGRISAGDPLRVGSEEVAHVVCRMDALINGLSGTEPEGATDQTGLVFA